MVTAGGSSDFSCGSKRSMTQLFGKCSYGDSLPGMKQIIIVHMLGIILNPLHLPEAFECRKSLWDVVGHFHLMPFLGSWAGMVPLVLAHVE